MLDEILIKINEMIDRGASFCHVDKIKHEIHEMDVITEGYHKWHGAIPIFSIIDRIRRVLM